MMTAILVSGLITFGLRAIPYIFFGSRANLPSSIVYLGKYLPPAIMAALVIYTTKDLFLFDSSFGPLLVAVVATTGIHLAKRNTFLSIIVGTAIYMLLLRL